MIFQLTTPGRFAREPAIFFLYAKNLKIVALISQLQSVALLFCGLRIADGHEIERCAAAADSDRKRGLPSPFTSF